ncbi:MAG: ATP-binding protein [Lautropia sp.]
MISLRARILVLIAVSGLATALILSLVMINAARNLYADLISHQANAFAERVLQMHPSLLADYRNDKSGLSAMLRSYVLLAPDTGLFLLSADGEILATAGEGRLHWSRYRVDLPLVRRALSTDPGRPIFGDDPDMPGSRCVVAARPLDGGDGEGGWLYVVARSADLVTQTPELVKTYALRTGAKVGILTLTISAALTLAVIALLTRPLTRLTRQVERIQRAGFANAIDASAFPVPDRDDEVGRLASSFREAFMRLKDESDRVAQTDTRRREMVASVSHDLRTPLTALAGQLETVLLKRETMADQDQRRFIESAFGNALHLRRLTDALAELARLDSPDVRLECEPIALHELCDDLVHRFQIRAEEHGIALQVDYPDGLPLAEVDAGLMERALANLIDNALRVTPDGGRIRIEVAPITWTGPQARTGFRVSVTDTGPGVSDADRPQVFERFFQGSGHRGLRGSSGLGLAIVQRVAELHGGRAGLTAPAAGQPADGTARSDDARNETGASAGACFYIDIPLASCTRS